MVIKFAILSFQHVFEDGGIDVREREVVLIESKEEKSFIEGNMDEKPESIRFGVANDKKITDNKVNPLSVTHVGKVISDSFEYKGEMFFLKESHLKCSIEIFLNLRKTFMLEYVHILNFFHGLLLPDPLLICFFILC